MNEELSRADRCYLLMKAPPNPDTVLCIEGLTDTVPRLKFVPVGGDLAAAVAIPGNPQGDRFHWEPFPLPETFVHAPFDRKSGEWLMMLHLCRPREIGMLDLRLYLKRFWRDRDGAQWHYMMSFNDRAPALKLATHGEPPGLPLHLSSCLAPLRLSTYIHGTQPLFDFDLRLRSGDAWIVYVQRDTKDMPAEVSVSDAAGQVLLKREGTLRDLSIRCDLESCQRIPQRTISDLAGQKISISASLDTGPWSGVVSLQDVIQL